MIRKEQQRFSLRKYKVGVASVFLGITLSFMMANSGAVLASELPAQANSEEKTEMVSHDDPIGESSKKEEVSTEVVPKIKEDVAKPEATDANSIAELQPASEVKEEAKPETTEAKFEA